MAELFGHTRDVVSRRYAIFTPAGFVCSNVPGWRSAECVVAISPQLGAAFSQFLINLSRGGRGRAETGQDELFIYVLEGKVAATVGGTGGIGRRKQTREIKSLIRGAHLYLPPRSSYSISAAAAQSRLLVFQKSYEPLAGAAVPELRVGHEKDVEGQPFMGNADARLQVLLPDNLSFDMAVNIFTYQPGATLPLVETHVMEHGLLMLRGQGIYRLGGGWYPVRAGDVIWMAPYCPQWFVAMGATPASYIYYKDVNRERVGAASEESLPNAEASFPTD